MDLHMKRHAYANVVQQINKIFGNKKNRNIERTHREICAVGASRQVKIPITFKMNTQG